MQRGSLIIYDNNGKIWVNTGDAEGDVLPHDTPNGLPYIVTKFGELEGKKVLGVDVKNKKLILEDIPKVETIEDTLNKELLKAQDLIVNLKYKELINENSRG